MRVVSLARPAVHSGIWYGGWLRQLSPCFPRTNSREKENIVVIELLTFGHVQYVSGLLNSSSSSDSGVRGRRCVGHNTPLDGTYRWTCETKCPIASTNLYTLDVCIDLVICCTALLNFKGRVAAETHSIPGENKTMPDQLGKFQDLGAGGCSFGNRYP